MDQNEADILSDINSHTSASLACEFVTVLCRKGFSAACVHLKLVISVSSQVSHKGLLQGWTQISLYLQIMYFTIYHTTGPVLLLLFLAYLYSAGTTHGNLHQAQTRQNRQ